MSQKARAISCLYGQAIGDALGTRYEFDSPTVARGRIEKDRDAKGHLPILGGGPFSMVKGQVTDDTELAMALAHSLLEKRTFDVGSVAVNYRTWYKSNPPDIGNTTRAALGHCSAGGTPTDVAGKVTANAKRNNMESLSNGCLMRISPLAIAGSTWSKEALLRCATADCRLTNPNEITQDAVSVFVAAIRRALKGGSHKDAFHSAEKTAQTDRIKMHIADAKESVQNPQYARHIGYCGVALQCALYHVYREHTLEEALPQILALGGDTDTNGCIAGALLGALTNDKESIPRDWRDAVRNANPTQRLREYEWVRLDRIEDVAVKLLECGEPSADSAAKSSKKARLD